MDNNLDDTGRVPATPKTCRGAHCKCMNLNKTCPNPHYGDHDCQWTPPAPDTQADAPSDEITLRPKQVKRVDLTIKSVERMKPPILDSNTQPGDEQEKFKSPGPTSSTSGVWLSDDELGRERQAAYTQGRRDELDGIVGEIGPLIKGETWKDWAWRVKDALEARAAALQEKPKA
jgi:hypothetical protein